ncbi:MAG TPA: hypothetical protein VE079_03265 [Ensifer sp.]|nr:hypothetical protein [Ensifer sp.]
MADYREISQQYAQKGIIGAFVLNGLAAITLLSQASALIERGIAGEIAHTLYWWAGGTLVATFTWIIAFISTRYVDKSERETSHRVRFETISDRWMLAGLATFIISLLCFAFGSITLGLSFRALGFQH